MAEKLPMWLQNRLDHVNDRLAVRGQQIGPDALRNLPNRSFKKNVPKKLQYKKNWRNLNRPRQVQMIDDLTLPNAPAAVVGQAIGVQPAAIDPPPGVEQLATAEIVDEPFVDREQQVLEQHANVQDQQEIDQLPAAVDDQQEVDQLPAAVDTNDGRFNAPAPDLSPVVLLVRLPASAFDAAKSLDSTAIPDASPAAVDDTGHDEKASDTESDDDDPQSVTLDVDKRSSSRAPGTSGLKTVGVASPEASLNVPTWEDMVYSDSDWDDGDPTIEIPDVEAENDGEDVQKPSRQWRHEEEKVLLHCLVSDRSTLAKIKDNCKMQKIWLNAQEYMREAGFSRSAKAFGHKAKSICRLPVATLMAKYALSVDDAKLFHCLWQ
ncbi:uncharacterized protein LOC131672474 [Phymastichus coffea]|uniref:uncharacterized protein LOC131672137 n=1 Tax=Phymastichus coffea TaxID=108790 RepID=UPI00273AF046|nr:uncharacterized protein LOC131672137 [Phymastichus coffea]XP_058805696.1 uncharacterized protein LOC131672474 [Phymastichus coffea]